MTADHRSADAVRAGLITPNESDSNGEPANVTDGLFAIARALHAVADAIAEHRDLPTTERKN